MHNSSSRGFTLIELVMVIVLVGILAATALPKFANLSTQARTAAAAGVSGALGAAVSIAHAQWLANGNITPILLEGTSIRMSTQGWPEATTIATTPGVVTTAKCLEVWNGILKNAPVAAVTTAACTGNCQYVSGVTGTTTCTFTDQKGVGTNVVKYNITTGAVSL